MTTSVAHEREGLCQASRIDIVRTQELCLTLVILGMIITDTKLPDSPAG